MKKNTIRKRTQRKLSVEKKQCENCGSTINLQRHHEEYNESGKVALLCQNCHKNLHYLQGNWGRGLKKIKNCKICGKEFLPNHSKNHNTCSKTCLSELGKRNANKRWHKDLPSTCQELQTTCQTEWTELSASEMQSFLSKRGKRSSGSCKSSKKSLNKQQDGTK